MGRKLVLTGTAITDTDAPILATIDPIESSGSLLLMEPGHPLDTTTGVPANGESAQNLFAATATSVVGNASHPVWTKPDISGGKGLMERSTKGGLHFVPSRTLSDTYVELCAMLPTALKTYLLANDTDHYYISTWLRKTRLEVSSANSSPLWISNNTDPATNYLVYDFEAGGAGGGTGDLIAGTGIARTTGPYRIAIHADAWEGTEPGDASEMLAFVFGFSSNNIGSTAPTKADLLFYRAYLENLTESGRTYSEVDALDEALYTQHVLTAGGRYYGDSYTDPATVV